MTVAPLAAARRAGRAAGVAPAFVAVLALGALLAGPAQGQALRQQLERTRAPLVRFSFPAKPGVCGAGSAIMIREPDGQVSLINDRHGRDHGWRVGEPPCDTGDVVVTAERDDGRFRDVRVRVGRPGAGVDDPVAGMAVELGRVSGPAAADLLLGLAAEAGPRAAGRMLLAASLAARATTWPGLLRLARNRELDSAIRRDAMFWLGRQAGARITDELGAIARDPDEGDEVRAAAVFALSRLPEDEAIPRLLQLGRSAPDPLVRAKALFWLAQFDDPRVTDAFEDILSGGSG